MRAHHITLVAATVLTYSTLYGDINDGDVSQESMPDASQKPFQVTAYGDSVSKAKFKNSDLNEEGVRYGHAGIEGVVGFYENSYYNEAAYFEMDYSNTLIRWKENPYFSQTHFNTLSLSLGAFTERAYKWKLWAEADINIDLEHRNLSLFSTYDFFLWARYDYLENLRLHVGFLGEVGMKIDRLYPILGIDWFATDQLKFNLIFPLNISAVYMIDDHFSVALAGRFFSTRFRVSDKEPLPRALVSYRAAGIELAATYDDDSWIQSNVHIGYNIGGILKIANRHYEERRRLHFKSAPYYGGEVRIKF